MARIGVRLLALALLLAHCSRDAGGPSPSRASVPAPPVASEAKLPEAKPPEAKLPEAKPQLEATPGLSFTVIARLVDPGRPVSHCGVIHYKAVMKFDVLRIVDGSFGPSLLYAGVSCPEMPPTRAAGFRWVRGAAYELTLHSAGLRSEGTLIDAFEKEQGQRYELLQVEPVRGESVAR